MKKIYLFIDRVWGVISETVFVRFEFDFPIETLKQMLQEGSLTFASPYGGFTEWLILSSWCRRQGFGAILVANRKRILLFSKPLFFLQIIFRQRTYADLFLSKESGPRLLFCPLKERKKPNDPTPAEHLLREIYTKAGPRIETFHLVPVFTLWKKHVRGEKRHPTEFLLGLSSNPNFIGKIWYLLRQRKDSTLRSLTPLTMHSKEGFENQGGVEESEAMKRAKSTRRRILVLVNQEMRVALGPRYHSPIEVKETLMKDPDIQKIIEELAKKEGVDKKKTMLRAYKDLTEIAANYQHRFIEVMSVSLHWLFTRVFEGIVYDEKEMQEVRDVMKTKPVVFVASHRSHLDYLVVPYLLFTQDMVTPHIVAGINLSFWPVGTLLRFGGAFFIRRSFRGDALYSACLKKYFE